MDSNRGNRTWWSVKHLIGYEKPVTNEAFGKRVKFARELNGLTQKELGELIGGVSQVSVSRWENGFDIADVGRLPSLADELHCDLRWLLVGVDDGLLQFCSQIDVAIDLFQEKKIAGDLWAEDAVVWGTARAFNRLEVDGVPFLFPREPAHDRAWGDVLFSFWNKYAILSDETSLESLVQLRFVIFHMFMLLNIGRIGIYKWACESLFDECDCSLRDDFAYQFLCHFVQSMQALYLVCCSISLSVGTGRQLSDCQIDSLALYRMNSRVKTIHAEMNGMVGLVMT